MLSWNRIRAVYERTPERHAKAARLVGFACPPPVFTALFHDRYQDRDLDRVLREVDLSRIEWVLEERSGVQLQEVSVDRAFQPAVDEAYREWLLGESWQKQETWIEPPILIAGEVLGSAVRDVLLVGATRFGYLRAMMDRGRVPQAARHRVWIGACR
jgi:hypothetical protein